MEAKQDKPRPSVLDLLASLALAATFFLPWFRLSGSLVPAYDAPAIAQGLTGFLAIPGAPQVYVAYLLYLIPVFALLTLVLRLLGRNAAGAGFLAGLLPIVLLLTLWIQLGNTLFGLMALGAVLALVVAPVVLLTSVGGLKLAYGIDWFTTRLGKLMYVVALAMVTVGAGYVIARYVGRGFGLQVTGANLFRELQVFLFNMVFLLAAAYVLRQDAHVRVDLIYTNLSARAKAIIDVIGATFLLTPFCLLGLYLSHAYVMRSWRVLEISPNPGGLPLYPVKTLILLGFFLILLQGVSEIIKNIAFLSGRLKRDAPAEPTITEKTEAL